MTEDKKEVKGKYELVYVPTGQALAIQTPSGQTMSQEEVLVEILNILTEIKKVV
jgi:hypothetical protein